MAASLLDSVVEDLTGYTSSLTVSAGSNRRLYFVTHTGEVAEVVRPTAVTYGGQSMTRLGSQSVPAGHDVATTVWELDETGIAAASGTTLTVTGGSANQASHWWSIQDAGQGAHTVAEAIGEATSGSLSLVRVADGYTGVALTHDVAAVYGAAANPSITNEGVFDVHIAAIGHEVSISETVNSTWSHDFNRGDEHVAWTIGPAVAGTPPLYHRRHIGFQYG